MIHLLSNDWPHIAAHRGWSRRVAAVEDWWTLGEMLRHGGAALLGLWGAREAVHAALYQQKTNEVLIASLAVVDNKVPSLAAAHAPAMRLERALRDLYGIEVVGLPDRRPWLDHGRWGLSAPLASAAAPTIAGAYEFLPAHGPALHQIPVGPVHAGIIEPGHFRFSAHGEAVARLEARLGYAHKGVEKLMEDQDVSAAARIAARVSGDSTVAYSWAFCRALEQALGAQIPARALCLRALMAELERIANHLGDIGAVCNDAAFTLMHMECCMLREQVLRAAAVAFGHRLMMDRIQPGGVAVDLGEQGGAAIAAAVKKIRGKFPELVELYDNTASLQDRTVGTGIVTAELAAEYACGGYVGRASGRDFDTRRALAYAPYDVLAFDVPVLREGDVDARLRIRIAEVEQSLRMVERLLESLPDGPIHAALPVLGASVESTAMVEGFRGDVLAYLRLDAGGRVARCHLRDPSWFQWPLLEAAIEGNIVADFPLCNKSFNCSYSGQDL